MTPETASSTVDAVSISSGFDRKSLTKMKRLDLSAKKATKSEVINSGSYDKLASYLYLSMKQFCFDNNFFYFDRFDKLFREVLDRNEIKYSIGDFPDLKRDLYNRSITDEDSNYYDEYGKYDFYGDNYEFDCLISSLAAETVVGSVFDITVTSLDSSGVNIEVNEYSMLSFIFGDTHIAYFDDCNTPEDYDPSDFSKKDGRIVMYER